MLLCIRLYHEIIWRVAPSILIQFHKNTKKFLITLVTKNLAGKEGETKVQRYRQICCVCKNL